MRLQKLQVMAVWETLSQLCQWCQKVFKSQIGGPCIWGKQTNLESQPCSQNAKMMLCSAIVIGTLEDCVIHPMEQRGKHRARQRQGLLGVGCPCFGTSQALLRPTFRTSRNSVAVVPFRWSYCVFNALQIWPTLVSDMFVLALGLKVCIGRSEPPTTETT